MPLRRPMYLTLSIALLACTERSPAPTDSASAPSIEQSGATPATTAEEDAGAGAMLALDGEGLRVIVLPSGSTRLIAFDEPRSEVVALVSRVRDGRQPELSENLDCPASIATWPASGLQLWFTSDSVARFIGWSLRGRATTDRLVTEVTTMSGIGLGSTRAELESVYDARITRSSLGVEFTAAGLAGSLSSDQADATIENLWAGQVCLAR